jgi:hypothetical protein
MSYSSPIGINFLLSIEICEPGAAPLLSTRFLTGDKFVIPSLMFIAYNFRRIGNILTLKVLKEYLGMLVSFFLAISDLTGAVLRHFALPGTLRREFAGYSEFSRKTRCATGNPVERSFFLKIQRGCQTDCRWV